MKIPILISKQGFFFFPALLFKRTNQAGVGCQSLSSFWQETNRPYLDAQFGLGYYAPPLPPSSGLLTWSFRFCGTETAFSDLSHSTWLSCSCQSGPTHRPGKLDTFNIMQTESKERLSAFRCIENLFLIGLCQVIYMLISLPFSLPNAMMWKYNLDFDCMCKTQGIVTTAFGQGCSIPCRGCGTW